MRYWTSPRTDGPAEIAAGAAEIVGAGVLEVTGGTAENAGDVDGPGDQNSAQTIGQMTMSRTTKRIEVTIIEWTIWRRTVLTVGFRSLATIDKMASKMAARVVLSLFSRRCL